MSNTQSRVLVFHPFSSINRECFIRFICNVAFPSSLTSLGSCKSFLKNTYVSFNVSFLYGPGLFVVHFTGLFMSPYID